MVSRGKPRRLRAPTFGAVLDKGTARAGPMSEANALGLACALRLAAKHHRDAESVIIGLKEHYNKSRTGLKLRR